MVNRLGETWGIMEMGIKPYPCTRWYSTPIYMFKQIMNNEDLKPDDIEAITVKGHPAMAKAKHITRVLRWDEWSPKNALNAQFSLSYNLACAAFDIPIGPRWQLRETLIDPRIVEFTKKVTAAKDEKCEQRMIAYLKSDKPKGKVMTQVHYTIEVDSTKGTFTDTADYIYGDTYDPEHRLSRDALKEKFVNNTSSIVDTKTTTELIDATYRLDSCDSIDEFVGLFE